MSEQVTTISAKDVVHLKILYIFDIAQLFFFIWIPTAALMKELVDSHSRSDAEITKKWIPTAGRMKELMDSHSSSDDRIGGFPQ